ncbi:protein yellow-like [Mizuhopecten yessoensis]|uniref:Protein yellow n=1 Tax=Mizuhopecten yessoensis TaxID=6573 RepID=A0A210Q9L7_MIZYE|nr:protein yellow-like [Mizuhopecten yessoensis]OWF45424.1 Protein yellow [Mizuhopecten yessoensis]
MKHCVCLGLTVVLALATGTSALSRYKPFTNCDDERIVHRFTVIDYIWPSDTAREHALEKEDYIPHNNIISGMKTYDNKVYVTVPRWRRGVPSTLNKVIVRNGTSMLQPFPSWKMQKIGDCRALQFVQSMEIDPNTGWMWIIDTGRINFFAADGTATKNVCPAKIVIYDINKMEEVTRHEFPNHVADRNVTFLNDIVVMYSGSRPRYAFISDTFAFRMVVYDMIRNTSHFFSHPSMLPEPGNGNITIMGETLSLSAGINGIAMSSDMKFIYFGSISGYSVYQIPSRVARNPHGNFARYVRKVGVKPSQGEGMTYSRSNHLYFSDLTSNSINRWDIDQDRKIQRKSFQRVAMKSVSEVLSSNTCMNFVDTLTFDTEGYLWFTVNKLHKYILTSMDFTGSSGPNVLIWKVYVGEVGYLDRRRTIKLAPCGRRCGPNERCDVGTNRCVCNHGYMRYNRKTCQLPCDGRCGSFPHSHCDHSTNRCTCDPRCTGTPYGGARAGCICEQRGSGRYY